MNEDVFLALENLFEQFWIIRDEQPELYLSLIHI